MMPRCAQRPRDVEGAGKLVGLHPYQHHQPDSRRPRRGRQSGAGRYGYWFRRSHGSRARYPSPRRRLLGAGLGEPIEHRQGIGRNRRSVPLDDIAVVVVMRGLDQHEAEAPGSAEGCRSRARGQPAGWARCGLERLRNSPGHRCSPVVWQKDRQPRKPRRRSKFSFSRRRGGSAWFVILRLITGEPTRMIQSQAGLAIGAAAQTLYFIYRLKRPIAGPA